MRALYCGAAGGLLLLLCCGTTPVPAADDAGRLEDILSAMRARLVSLERKPELPDDTFAFKFPVGTVVFDRDRGLRHVVLADGRTRDITPEDSASGFDDRALLETSPAKPAPRLDAAGEEWTPSTIVLLAANVLLLVAGAAFWCLREGE